MNEFVTVLKLGIKDEYILQAYIQLFTPLTYGIEGRLKFVTSSEEPEPNCTTTDVTGTVFCELLNN